MAGSLGEDSPAFNAVNRGKRSLVVDIKKERGQELVKRLAGTADVLVENFRPGVMKRCGLDYAALSNLNPRLIYASISGYGQTGPYCAKGGFDLVAQGMSGIMSVTGEEGRPPVKSGIPVTDLGAGLLALSAILAALIYRNKTGVGQYIDTSLLEAGIALSVWEATEYLSTGVAPKPLGSAHRMSAPYQALQCSDGYVTVGAANDGLFQVLCNVLGHPDWINDPRFEDDSARVKNHLELAQCIEAVTLGETKSYWLDKFEKNGIPSGPINSYSESLSDEHILNRDMVVETQHPTLGTIKTLGAPVKMSKTPFRTGRPAPVLGQDTESVLQEAGYRSDEVAELRKDKVVRLAAKCRNYRR
tara:strand:+ start:134 stop:1210 length:1077 start_codon:yes stop_codon:yes gene_type:complete